MSGIHRGVQSSIRERILIAQYVHSKAYILSLAIVHSSTDVSVRTMMATMVYSNYVGTFSCIGPMAFTGRVDLVAGTNSRQQSEQPRLTDHT